ncbi:MAG: hypothetical protein JSV05_06850 [Candidatus Bathyarchaeota archaeon]|nr:MAG: hypothetical protein JSV05_06850 [Candidatus Bathyarchaeota archaeon]
MTRKKVSPPIFPLFSIGRDFAKYFKSKGIPKPKEVPRIVMMRREPTKESPIGIIGRNEAREPKNNQMNRAFLSWILDRRIDPTKEEINIERGNITSRFFASSSTIDCPMKYQKKELNKSNRTIVCSLVKE